MIRNILQISKQYHYYMPTMSIGTIGETRLADDDEKQSIDDNSNIDDSCKQLNIYEKAEAYWASVSSNVDGMLGGFSALHSPDIADSRTLLRTLIGRVCLCLEND